jgi:recombination protein RecT
MSGGAIVAQKEALKTFRGLLQRMKPQIAMAIPKNLDADRMIRMSMSVVQQNPKLLECTQASVLGAIMTAAQLGLYPDTSVLGHAFFVPYKTKCTFIAGYKGLIDLARRSGHVTSIMAHAVYEGDMFQFEYGLNPILRHKPSGEPLEGREITHVFAIARILNEPIAQFVVMTKEEVDAIRKRSPARDRGPWVTDYEPMAIKTAIRRLAKYLPLSSDLQRAVSLDEHAEAGIDQGLETVGAEVLEGLADIDDPMTIDTTATVVEGDEEEETNPLDEVTDNMPSDEPDEYQKTWLRGNEIFGDDEWKKIMAKITKKPGSSMTAEERKAATRAMEKAIEKGG